MMSELSGFFHHRFAFYTRDVRGERSVTLEEHSHGTSIHVIGHSIEIDSSNTIYKQRKLRKHM